MSSLVAGRTGVGVHQNRRFIELRNQYTLTDDVGVEVGRVEQTKQSPLAFLARLFGDMDIALPVTLSITNADGQEELRLHKPWFRYAVAVRDSDGRQIGSVNKRIRVGKAVFTVVGDSGQEVGSLKAENWRARHFRFEDPSGREVARVTKSWRGLLTEAITDADSYAVTFDDLTDTTTRNLALAAALAVDVTMKQKDY